MIVAIASVAIASIAELCNETSLNTLILSVWKGCISLQCLQYVTSPLWLVE